MAKKTRAAVERELMILKELTYRRAKEDHNLFSSSYIKITDKKGDTVPLKCNHVQKEITYEIQKLRDRGVPPRIIVLKSRQMGVSTNEQARMLRNCVTKSNRQGLIVAHRDDATSTIFEKSKFMYEHLPDDVKPLKKASNSRELIFDTPVSYIGKEEGLNSGIKVQTAGSLGIGRGDRNHYVHLSEFGFWEGVDDKSPIKQLSGIMQSVPDVEDSLVVIESTANGYNDFKTLWDEAVAGKNGWTPLFYPWWVHEEYIRPFEDEMQKDKFFLEMDDYEKELYDEHGISLERINWHRYTKKTKCNNDLNQMKQENPTTPEEAFLMSGTPVFDNNKINNRINYLRSYYKFNPYIEGSFRFEWGDPETKDFIKNETITFKETKSTNYVRIYEKPQRNTPYVIGGDTKGEGKDYFAATVIDNSTGKRVASLHMQVSNSKPFTWQIYCLGMYYNTALLAIEMNFNTAPIEELQRLKYRKQYTRRKYDDYTHQPTKRYGWKTTGTTRPIIIDKEIEVVSEAIEVFNDIPTLQEMLTFIYDKQGRPDAMSGKHDDLLISDMIANEVRREASTTGSEDSESLDLNKLPKDYQEDYRQAVKHGLKDMILDSWAASGILDKIKKIQN